MNGKSYFSMLARYHRWAYERLYERVGELDEQDYRADHGLFFKSVHGTLNHLLLVDRLWLDRLRGVKTGRVDLAAEVEADRTRLRDGIFVQCQAFITYADALDESQLEHDIRYVSSQGEPFTRPLAPLIAHIVNHATHHRGQVSTALSQCGLEAPVMDIPYFLAEEENGQDLQD